LRENFQICEKSRNFLKKIFLNFVKIFKNKKFLENEKLKIEKNFEKSDENFLQKNAKNCKICGGKKILKNKISGENFAKKIAEKSCSGAEKIRRKINLKKSCEKLEIFFFKI